MTNTNHQVFLEKYKTLSTAQLQSIIQLSKNSLIKIKNTKTDSSSIAFFCIVPSKNDKDIPVLFTTTNIINDEDQKFKFELSKCDENQTIKIESKHLIYINKILDILIINIKSQHITIKNIVYLELDSNINNSNYKSIYTDKIICVLHYDFTEKKDGLFFPGVIQDIHGINIVHNCDSSTIDKTKKLNNPVILADSLKLIAIDIKKYTLFFSFIIKEIKCFKLSIAPVSKTIVKKKVYYTDGEYEGYININTNKKEGKGIFKYLSGNVYEGNWENDKQSGNGVYYWTDKEIYNGEWVDGYMEGKGNFYYKNGDIFEGEFRHDKKNGTGIYYYTSGNKYIGEYKNDKPNGKGTFLCTNGNKYEGNFINENLDGTGNIHYNNGNVYEGSWVNGNKEGKGVLNLKNGEKYEGDWLKDEMSGKGIYYFNSKSRYDGLWKKGQINGYGIYYYNNMDRYEGNWVNGDKNGYGIYYYNVGDRYEGYWKNGMKDGDGVYYYNNGNVRKGRWKNDNKIE